MPDYSWLRSFGCMCFPHVDSSMRNKFAPKARQCIFLGYSAIRAIAAFHFPTRKELIYRHVTFFLRNLVFFDIGLFGSYWFSSAWAFHGCDSGFQTSRVYGSVSYPCRCWPLSCPATELFAAGSFSGLPSCLSLLSSPFFHSATGYALCHERSWWSSFLSWESKPNVHRLLVSWLRLNTPWICLLALICKTPSHVPHPLRLAQSSLHTMVLQCVAKSSRERREGMWASFT